MDFRFGGRCCIVPLFIDSKKSRVKVFRCQRLNLEAITVFTNQHNRKAFQYQITGETYLAGTFNPAAVFVRDQDENRGGGFADVNLPPGNQ